MSKKQPLVNAGQIIERFGGIRPMAAKIDAPVTTVQGWKKRDVIPGTRRTQILSAGVEHNIDISDLIEAGVSSAASDENVSHKPKKKKVSSQKTKKRGERKKENKTSEPASSVPSVSSSHFEADKDEEEIEIKEEVKSSIHETLISEIEENNRKSIAASAWVATGLILLAIVVGGFLLWPNFKNSKAQLNEQSQQLVSLKDDVKEVKVESQKKFLGPSFPDDMQTKFDGLQNQARNISVTVDQLSKRAKEISMEALGGSTEAISSRLDILETKVEEMSGPEGSFSALVARVRGLEKSVAGQVQLENSADQLRSILGRTTGDINGDIANAQGEADGGALGRTLDGVAGQDLKAAAVLIAFSQFRSSLEREAPFEEDLALLQNLIGNDNPALQENLTRLSRHADGGVLTASGLSKELKKLTGDIVVSSLTGEDVSIKEKAMARFGSIVQIEKDGEMVSGTKTQATVAKAQEYVEEGQIEDSISALQGLDGTAAMVVGPFIEKAKASLLAEKVKTMLNETILSKATNQSVADPSAAINNLPIPDHNLHIPNIDMDELKHDLEEAAPFLGEREIIKDEDSGIIILPRNPGFRGFSGGE